MRLLRLTNTELAFNRVFAGVVNGMRQQGRLTDEDQQQQGKTTAARK